MRSLKKSDKPDAKSKTVDMFTGKTQLEEALSASEVIEETPRGSETIEQAAERWRQNAFYTNEFMSKRFTESVPETAKFRLTKKDGAVFLEKFQLGKDGYAYHWSGVMFKESDMDEITSVFVSEWRSRNG